MKGIALSEKYWLEVGKPAFEKSCPEVLEHCAVGLVGEGSECFGFDDAVSRDHDWGPGFCMWLTADAISRYGRAAAEVYASLPHSFMGFERLRVSDWTSGRVGVLEIHAFYSRFIGKIPQTLIDWQFLPESGLATATNGRVFFDSEGDFSFVRDKLLAYYPEDVRRKKLAAHCALAAQSGQYNYYRCHKRGEHEAEFLALSEFVKHTQAIVFLLNRRYMPYYKWSSRAMRELPILGTEISEQINALIKFPADTDHVIERIAAKLIRELKEQDLSTSASDFLLNHAAEIQERIADPQISALHLMQE